MGTVPLLAARLYPMLPTSAPLAAAQVNETIDLINQSLDARLSNLALILAIVAVTAIVIIALYLIRKEGRESSNDRADRELMKQQLDNNGKLIGEIAVSNDLVKQVVTGMAAQSQQLAEIITLENKRAQETTEAHKTVVDIGNAVLSVARSLATERADVVQGVSAAMTKHLNERDHNLGEDRARRDRDVDRQLADIQRELVGTNRKLDILLERMGIKLPDNDDLPDPVPAPEPPAESALPNPLPEPKDES